MKTSVKIIHWLPRIICIIAILFISLFAFDVFSPEHTIWQQIRDLLMHLIPSFILIAILLYAWRWEYSGGIIFTIVGIGFSPFIFMKNYNMNHSIGMSTVIVLAITIPFLVVGVLFIVSYFMKKNRNQAKLH